MSTKKRKLVSMRSAVIYGSLVLISFFCLFPVIWGIGTAFKTNAAINQQPPQWIPSPVITSNFGLVWGSMQGYLVNTLIVTIGTLIPVLLIAAHGGYAAARYEFKGKNTVLFGILAAGMIPGIAILIPLYMITAKLGLLNTYTGLIIIYTAWLVPNTLWLLRGFFQSIPQDLEEAALIDGCNAWSAFYRIVMPLTRPGLAAAGIMVFIYVWNEFIIALTLTTDNNMRMAAVGLYFYLTSYGIEWGKLMAAATIALVPVVVAFIILQKQFVEGLTSGATKG